MAAISQNTCMRHKSLGECEFIRLEGTDWIVRHLESGAIWRFSVSCRRYFTIVADNEPEPENGPRVSESLDQPSNDSKTLIHPTLGECLLVRTEGVDWIIRPISSKTFYRCPPQARRVLKYKIQADSQSSAAESATDFSQGPGSEVRLDSYHNEDLPNENGKSNGQNEPYVRVEPQFLGNTRLIRRAFESMRNGLPPAEGAVEQFAIGIDKTTEFLDRMLDTVNIEGGNSCVIRGAYGQGKTFSLKVLKQRALRAGYLVASTEVDAYENQLHKPHHIYRDLLANLMIPDSDERGVRGLLKCLDDYLRQSFHGWNRRGGVRQAEKVRGYLEVETQCDPLAWLLSDPAILEKEALVGLLDCEPGIRIGEARKNHVLPSKPRDWPSFKAGTQGDFASFVLSGLGRLARLLEFKGLLVVLDEMEKWEMLDWKAQSRAGNLFGGLVWGATAETGHRSCRYRARVYGHDFRIWENCDHSSKLQHSGMSGGYPFSTRDRSFLGVAVAMTPRGKLGPEDDWSHYGLLEVIDLPSFDGNMVGQYFADVARLYQTAYSISDPVPGVLARKALKRWQHVGDQSARSATKAVIETLDEWRNEPQSVM